MKVNPAFVSILIIAISLAIHLSTYIQPSHLLWGVLNWAHLRPTHLLLRCLRSLSCGGLKWGSYHGPHTFSKVSSPVVMGRSELGLFSWPTHLPSEVSLVAPRFSTTMWIWERLLPLTTQKEKVAVHSSQSFTSISMFGALCLSSLCLTAPPTPSLFGVFVFHRRSPFITDVCTPSIRCLYNSSSFLPCMHWKGLRLLPLSRAQETSCCTQSLL